MKWSFSPMFISREFLGNFLLLGIYFFAKLLFLENTFANICAYVILSTYLLCRKMVDMDLVMPYVQTLLSKQEKIFTETVGYFLSSSEQTCPNCHTHGLSSSGEFYAFQGSTSIYICDGCHNMLHKGRSFFDRSFLMPQQTKYTVVSQLFALKLRGIKKLLREISWFNKNTPKMSEKELSELNMTREFHTMIDVVKNAKAVVAYYKKEFFNYDDAVKQHTCCVFMQAELDHRFDALHAFFTQHIAIIPVYSNFDLPPKRHVCQ